MTRLRSLLSLALSSAGALALALPACALDSADPALVGAADEADADEVRPDVHGAAAHDHDHGAADGAGAAPGATALLAAKSQGFYSFPYVAGTTVHVTNDSATHTPENRIDMSGTSGGPYKVVAAAGGWVRFAVDHHTGTTCADNNYVWLEHPNGEWTKYSHIATSSADQAGVVVGEWVNAGEQLGIEGDVGCASGDHVHFEVAVPRDPADPIQASGGYIKGSNLDPKVCGTSNQSFVAGQNYVVPDVRPGGTEYTRSGVSDDQFQAIFSAAVNCGYQLTWIDGYDRNGTATFNAVFTPKEAGVAVISHRRLTAAELDDKIAQYVEQDGYNLVHIDAYNVGSVVRYAAIFKRGASVPATITYHGVSAAVHQSTLDSLTGSGWRPRVISATSVSGTRTYAGVYTFGSIGSYQAKSAQTEDDYQANYDANKAAGRRLIYLNTYLHNGAPYYTAIWASSAPTTIFARHAMSAASLQSHWDTQTGAGRTTGAITAVFLNGASRFAAYWFD